MKGRTTREFIYKTDLWPILDKWAAETGYVLETEEKSRRVYRRGNRLLMAPTFLEIRKERNKAILEAWVSADFYLFMTLLSGKKPESRIDSGGLTAAVPRKQARDAVNRLLVQLKQPLIT